MSTPYDKAFAAIDSAHAQDPNQLTINGNTTPYELHYAQKSTLYLEKRLPNSPEHVRLAVRAQHFRRWEVARASYPMTRTGYLAWRRHLQQRQAEQVHDICVSCGYAEEVAGRVGALIRKEELKSDGETQVVEDVACLVFLEDRFAEFECAHDEEKVLRVLRKTWDKMSEAGRELALAMDMQGRTRELVHKALAAS